MIILRSGVILLYLRYIYEANLLSDFTDHLDHFHHIFAPGLYSSSPIRTLVFLSTTVTKKINLLSAFQRAISKVSPGKTCPINLELNDFMRV